MMLMAHGSGTLNTVATFRIDVLTGLSQQQKTLPCRWLYDAVGSALFERISSLDEYYLTRIELQVLESYLTEIADFMGHGVPIIEYGAGSDLTKIELVLKAVHPVEYLPVDISEAALAAAERLRRRYPAMRLTAIVGDFMTELPSLAPVTNRRTAFFPGSTIGNLSDPEIDSFFDRMSRHTGKAGRAIIGFDMCQRVEVLIPAYNDREGVTAAFNLNILHRANRELGADFRVTDFHHEAIWNERLRAMEMRLVSDTHQQAHIADRIFTFEPGEAIITEWSRKFLLTDIAELAERNGWRLRRTWCDADSRFALAGLEFVGV